MSQNDVSLWFHRKPISLAKLLVTFYHFDAILLLPENPIFRRHGQAMLLCELV